MKSNLGRGLTSLLKETDLSDFENNFKNENKTMVSIEDVTPNFDQPRKFFDKEKLKELASSILENGIIQPIIVRKKEKKLEIIAGERRWRAAQIALLDQIPVIIIDVDDKKLFEMSIVENIQRENLNPVDEAISYKKLKEEFHYTQDDVAKVLGKSRSYIANSLRLLTLPDEVIELIYKGFLSYGHARTLIGLDDSLNLAKIIVKKNLSVRETEKLIKLRKVSTSKQKKQTKDVDTKNIEKSLSLSLKYKVEIKHNKKQENGLVSINYDNLDEFDKICRLLLKKV